MNCLICQGTLESQLTFFDLVFGGRIFPNVCCEVCFNQFKKIENTDNSRCSRCLRKNTTTNLCEDCFYWEKLGFTQEHTALYEYNDAMSDYMSSYKFKGEERLSKVFAKDISIALTNMDYDLVIPIPMTKKRRQERGFHQVEALLKAANIEYETYLKKKKHTKKQSSLSKEERQLSNHYFYISSENYKKIKSKEVVLVDDVYTTGSTLHHAIKKIELAKPKSIKTFSLSR